jgi:hypothetical protein
MIMHIFFQAYVRLQPLDLSATVKSNLGKSGKLLDSGFITLERVLGKLFNEVKHEIYSNDYSL